MTGLASTVAQYWVEYVFGSSTYAGIFLITAIILLGLKKGWSLDIYLVLLVPLAFLMFGNMPLISRDIIKVFFIGVSALVAIMLIRFKSR